MRVLYTVLTVFIYSHESFLHLVTFFRIPGFPIRGTTFTASDLRDGTAYEFRVSAQNAAGRGEPSPATRPVVPRDAAGAIEGAPAALSGAMIGTSGAAPHVLSPLEDAYAKIGDSVTMSCKLSGNPQPDITW